MVSKIVRWGNSLGLRIPKAFAREAGLTGGTPIEMTVREGALMISARVKPRYELASLLKKVSSRNLHRGADFGAAGREIL